MLPAATAVLWTGALLGLLALAGFGWAWSVGHFADLDAQAWTLLDGDDLRYARPWETAHQRAARQDAYGPPLDAPPGTWGGAG
jgi:nitrogen fixation-related uncharacterized protein